MKKIIPLGLGAIVLLLVVYQALMHIDNYFPFGRMWQTPAVRPHEEKILIMQSGLVPFDGGETLYRSTLPEALVSPVDNQDPLAIAQGKVLYATFCVHCHGKYHDGFGTVGQSFVPPPGDLRSPKVQAMLDGQMFKEISYGIKDGRQPPLATTIAIPDRWKIIAYVKSLGQRAN